MIAGIGSVGFRFVRDGKKIRLLDMDRFSELAAPRSCVRGRSRVMFGSAGKKVDLTITLLAMSLHGQEFVLDPWRTGPSSETLTP